MHINHEEVQNSPRLPFYFYESGKPTIKPHWHQGIEINYLLKGSGLQFVLEGKTFHFNAGDIWIVNRNQVHSSSSIINKKLHYIGLIIDDDFLLSEFPSSINWNLQLMGQKSAKNKQQYQKLGALLKDIAKHITNPLADDNRFQILADLFQAIIVIDQYFNHPKPSQTAPNSSLVKDLISYVNQHHREDISATSIAQTFALSQVTLNKQLKQSSHLPIGAYLNLTRLLDARQLLLNTDKPIETIANEVGFSDSKVLNRNFKKWKGKTPTQYRNAYAKYHRFY